MEQVSQDYDCVTRRVCVNERPTFLEVVTSVFRQYETGLREGVIDVKVTFYLLIIYSND
jgi:hypothetical protein